MMEYWAYFRRLYEQPVNQSVFYIRAAPTRLEMLFEEGRTSHGFGVVNLQEYEAAELLASPDWGANLWALGGAVTGLLREILSKMVGMGHEELNAFSCMLNLDELLKEKLKEGVFHA